MLFLVPSLLHFLTRVIVCACAERLGDSKVTSAVGVVDDWSFGDKQGTVRKPVRNTKSTRKKALAALSGSRPSVRVVGTGVDPIAAAVAAAAEHNSSMTGGAPAPKKASGMVLFEDWDENSEVRDTCLLYVSLFDVLTRFARFRSLWCW